MSRGESRPSALMMEAQTPSIEEVAVGLLRETREPGFADLNPSERGSLEQEVSFFFNELTTIVLNWISSAHLAEIDKLSTALERALAKASDEPNGLADASVHKRLTARLDTLSYVLRAVSRTENLAKYMGQLSGRRRAAWGELLVAFYDAGHPVSKTDASEFAPSIKNPNTLYNALEQLVKMGLLERIEQANKHVLYGLSWPGRMVARAWRELHGTGGEQPALDRFDWDAMLKSLPAGCSVPASSSWGTGVARHGKISPGLVMEASAR